MSDTFDDAKGLENLKSDPYIGWKSLDGDFSDTVDLPKRPRAILLDRGGAAGTIIVVSEYGEEETLTLALGDVLEIRPVKIKAASTATGVKGLY